LTSPNRPKEMEVSGRQPRTNQAGRSITDTDSALALFWHWFKRSAVAETDGRPIVVFHGTRRDFAAFDSDAEIAHPWLLGVDNKVGFFFTKDPGRRSDSGLWTGAAGYAGTRQIDGETDASQGANIVPVYLSLQSPYKMTAETYRKTAARPDLKGELEALGYDGIEVDDGTYVAFYPEQIKSSVGNPGTYDPTDPRIADCNSLRLGAAIDLSSASVEPPDEPLSRRMRP
jgi:hypothetical protein